ncbi:hypothetical protein NXU94_24260 [Bacteroides faecis]|uniref:hypothetical protein n=1 Tax=Bacteroides faecis TaxID=674529 RepID=UPI0021662391|nr:hypothetical protein [Bacteroides faecis]MCS3070086.1 hypothetical protein [Bacteroides faecis]
MKGKNANYWYRLFKAGAYLVLLGLTFEAYEGGIRKILLPTATIFCQLDLHLWL